MASGGLWRPERFTDEAAAQACVVARGRANAVDAFAAIERVLADGRAWAAPDAYTAADAFLLVFHRWGPSAGVDMAAHPHWTVLTRRLLERPAVRAAFDKDGLA